METVNVDPIPPAPHPAEIDELRRALEHSTRLLTACKTGRLSDPPLRDMVPTQIAANERLLNAQ